MPPTMQLSAADVALINTWAGPVPDTLPEPGADGNPCDDQGSGSQSP
jgi:hypothetical protein